MRKIALLLLLSFTAVFAYAQKKTSDLLRETTQAYLNAENLSMDVVVHTYSTENSSGILLGKGLIRKSGVNYYSKFMTDELVINEDCMIILDHQEKTVTRYGQEQKKKRKSQGHELPNMDSIYSAGDSIVYKGVEDGKRHFFFYSKNKFSAVRFSEVFIDEPTHFVTKIVYYYNTTSAEESYDMYKVVIDYTAISTEKPDQGFFSEKKYFSYSKGKFLLTSSYSSYELIIAQ